MLIVAQEPILCTGGSLRCSQVSPDFPSSPYATPADSSTSRNTVPVQLTTLILGCRICLLQCVLKSGIRAVQTVHPIQRAFICTYGHPSASALGKLRR